MVTLRHQEKMTCKCESLDDHLNKKETVVGVTRWALKSYLFKALVLPTSTCGIEIWGDDLKNSHCEVFEKGIKIHMVSRVKVCSSTTYHISLAEFEELPMKLYAIKLTIGFQQRLAHLLTSWLVNQATSLSRHHAKQGCDTNWWPCEKHHGDSLNGKPMTPHTIKNHWWSLEVFLTLNMIFSVINYLNLHILIYFCY